MDLERSGTVLVSVDGGLEETIAVLSHPGALDEIRQAHQAMAAGDAVDLDSLAARHKPR